jgi:hypothetical protein
MKKLLLMVIALLTFSLANGQNVYRYFQDRGIKLLAKYAHPNRQFQTGYFDGNKNPKFIEVDIVYQDGNEMILRIHRGDPYFSRIDIVLDTGGDQPFFAVASAMDVAIRDATSHKKEEIEKIQQYMRSVYNQGPEQWGAKLWALFALNLDHITNQ